MKNCIRQVDVERTRQPIGRLRFTVSAFRLSGRGVF